jgi:hypothetical protein
MLNASPGQVAWRRDIIRTDYDTDLAGFHQEYPSTPTEAFISSGRQYFGANYINRFRPSLDYKRCRLTGEWKKGKEVRAEVDERGPLWVYKVPEKEHRYVMFIDPAGVVAETRARHFRDPMDVADMSCMWVIDCTTMETVAVWHSRIDIGMLGKEAAKLGRIYNNAIICPEVTGGFGWVVVQELRNIGYSAIHRDRNHQTYSGERSARYGWTTGVSTRPLMLETLRDVLRETPELLNHAPLRDEMMTFIIGAKPEAAPGCHDDLVMAAAGAYIVAQEYAQRKPIRLLEVSETLRKQRKRPRRFEDTLMRARR